MKNYFNVFKKSIGVISLSAICLLSIFPSTNIYAENYSDPAPYIQPSNANGEQILFDNTHGQTAGAADWVIDGGFSDYANGLAQNGYYVKELRQNTPITYSDLSNYSVFIIPEANIPFKTSEQNAILQYVQNGGSVFFIADHYNSDRNKNRWDASEIFNGYRRGAYNNPTYEMSSEEASSVAMQNVTSTDWLSSNFGVRFRYNAIGDVNATNIVSSSDCFGITNGVSSVAMHAGSTIAITDPNKAKGIVYLPNGLTQSSKWSSAVDNGVYDGGGIAEGAYVAIAKIGLGKAAFIGDSSAVEDATPKYLKEETGGTKTTYDGYKEVDDATLLQNLTNWLSTKETYTSFATAGIPLDSVTALYSYETPANSTEPQAEPWAAPASGYKWYDSTTFKSGSYNYNGSQTPTNPSGSTYVFSLPSTITAGTTLSMSLDFHNLTPNTTYSGYKIGAYLDNGTQIGKFAPAGSSLPSSYGYSSTFSVTTDSNGNASKQISFYLKDNTSGTFHLRLKQNSTNVITVNETISK